MLVNDPRHGPVPAFLLALTVVTGLVDAVSFLSLGHVFVSNMTGNVVFLGFAAAGAGGIAPQRSLAAIAMFAIGSAVGGRMNVRWGAHRGHVLFAAIAIEFALVLFALAVSFTPIASTGEALPYAQIILLALAMGIQNAVARAIGVPDLTTTVITLTMTAFASESFFGTGTNRNVVRRASAIGAMFVGALIGGLLVLRGGVPAALAAALVLLASTAIAVQRVSRGAPPWTQTA
jgi:uncharacterized membrane protein YoaK (UPF0700 family)